VPERGEVWQVDFGITQKFRPALVTSIPYGDADRALNGVIPHITATRGSQFEVSVVGRGAANDPWARASKAARRGARSAASTAWPFKAIASLSSQHTSSRQALG